MGWEEIHFASGDGRCAGRLFRPDAGWEPLPCVVMASGFSCVRDQGLDAFAERLAEAGFAALAFDYRHWGESPGEPRSLMAADLAELTRMIEAALPGAGVEVIDETGTGDHLRATVEAPQFEGLSRLDQHRLVKAAVRERFDDGTIHALSVKTSVPV